MLGSRPLKSTPISLLPPAREVHHGVGRGQPRRRPHGSGPHVGALADEAPRAAHLAAGRIPHQDVDHLGRGLELPQVPGRLGAQPGVVAPEQGPRPGERWPGGFPRTRPDHTAGEPVPRPLVAEPLQHRAADAETESLLPAEDALLVAGEEGQGGRDLLSRVHAWSIRTAERPCRPRQAPVDGPR